MSFVSVKHGMVRQRYFVDLGAGLERLSSEAGKVVSQPVVFSNRALEFAEER